MIIDTHQHFWNLEHPWSKGPEDYKIITKTLGITGTILRLPETQDALDLADVEPLIVGVCGAIRCDHAFEANLDNFSKNPLFKGICLIGNEIELTDVDILLSNMKLLEARHFQLDLLRVCPNFFGGPPSMRKLYTGTKESLARVFSIAKAAPNLPIVVEHIGGMAIDGGPPNAEWVDIFKRMATFPRIYIKVSGLMERLSGRALDEAASDRLSPYRATLETLWNIFGADRLIYGSNWPVSEHAGDFIAQGLNIVRPFFAEKGSVASENFFWRTSKDVYNWQPRLPSQS